MGDERIVPDDPEDWWDEGTWKGPRDLRLFLRKNAFFAGFYYVVFWWIALAVLNDVIPRLWGWYAPILAAGMALAPAALIMFLYSRGWISEGD